MFSANDPVLRPGNPLALRASALALCLAASVAQAQERSADSIVSLGAGASLDVGIGPDRRPHRALRFRFESATRAMRSMGVDADDCATVLRSSHHATGAPGEPSHLGLTVALNCRFF
jgi:hypothetical protein